MPDVTLNDNCVVPIAAAARWLDETYPGWAALIDPDNFDMTMAHTCIGGYLNVNWDYALRVRFQDDTEYSGTGVFSGWTEEWLVEIEARS